MEDNSRHWPADRLKELAKLDEMLVEVLTIDKGSGCLGRIAKCIELAEQLRKVDLRSGRKSFVSFLIEEAHKP